MIPFLKEIGGASSTTGFYSIDYMFWRYSLNQAGPFRVFTYNNSSGEILGFFVLNSFDKSIEIYDLFLKDKNFFKLVIKKIKAIAKKEKCRSIYFTVRSSGDWNHILKKYGFFDIKYHYSVFWLSFNDLFMGDWEFYKGNRNI